MIDVANLHACRKCRVVLPIDSDEWKRRKAQGSGKRHFPNAKHIDACRPCVAEDQRRRYAERMSTPEGRERQRAARRAERARKLAQNPKAVHEAERESARKYYKRHERKLRTKARRNYREKASTPEGRAEIAIDYRIRQRGHAAERGEEKRLIRYPGAHDLYRPSLRPDEHFNPEPFLDWIAETFPGWNLAAVARRLEISERTLRGIHDGDMQTVSILTVDHAFVTYGSPQLLNELYPLKKKKRVHA